MIPLFTSPREVIAVKIFTNLILIGGSFFLCLVMFVSATIGYATPIV